MAVTRFSGRTAPPHPGGAPNCGDWVMVEGYSHELSSAGFWPGGGGEGHFYSYAYPEPDKTSIREALGRAYFRSGRFEQARAEFAAVVERAPVNDFAHFCLGEALVKTGRRAEARHHAGLAAGMRPDRADYRALRDRLRAA